MTSYTWTDAGHQMVREVTADASEVGGQMVRFIPVDEDNVDWQLLSKLIAAGEAEILPHPA